MTYIWSLLFSPTLLLVLCWDPVDLLAWVYVISLEEIFGSSWGEYSCWFPSSPLSSHYCQGYPPGSWTQEVQSSLTDGCTSLPQVLGNKGRHGSVVLGVLEGDEGSSTEVRMAWLHWCHRHELLANPLSTEVRKGVLRGHFCFILGSQNKDTALDAATLIQGQVQLFAVDPIEEAVYVCCYRISCNLEMFVIDNNHSRSSWLLDVKHGEISSWTWPNQKATSYLLHYPPQDKVVWTQILAPFTNYLTFPLTPELRHLIWTTCYLENHGLSPLCFPLVASPFEFPSFPIPTTPSCWDLGPDLLAGLLLDVPREKS